MELDNFRLLVNDFAASLHFWRNIVGLKLIFTDNAGIYAYFEAGSARLELLRTDYFAESVGAAPPVPVQESLRGVVVFKVDDVDAAYADLVERGATPLAPPQQERAGFARTAHVLAPDGYVLEVFQSISPMLSQQP